MIDQLVARLRREPALVIGALAAAIVFLAGEFGIVLDEASLKEVLEPIVVAFVTRFFVSPAPPKTA